MKPLTLPIDSITWHPLVANLPRWSDDAPELAALADDIGARGLDQPLIVVESDGKYLLIDGRHRHLGCRQGGILLVDVIVRPEADALGIILGSLVQRRHYTKGALAYLSWPVASASMAQNGGNRGNQHKKLAELTESTLASVGEIAARLGFSRDLFFQARQVHEYLDRRSDMRAVIEPRILSGEVGLGAVVAGIAGKEATDGKKRHDRGPLDLISDAFKAVQTRFEYWPKMERSQQAAVVEEATNVFMTLPIEVQDSIAKALRNSRK